MDNLIKKYRIIGDIHGRTNWQKLIDKTRDDITYIFLGDFSDPYYSIEYVTFDQMIEQMELIFDFCRKHRDRCIILASNHDLQYILNKPETNRYDNDVTHREHLMALFEDAQDIIHGVAYNIGNKYLISHAGVTLDWYTKYCTKDEKEALQEELSVIVENVNNLWKEDKTAFTFRANAKMSDYSGISSTQSPLWVRPLTLWYNNLFGTDSGRIQIVGHTTFESDGFGLPDETYDRIGTIGTVPNDEIKYGWESPIKAIGNDNEHVDIILADCLRRETACVDIDLETMKWSKFYVEDVKSKISWGLTK